MHKSRDHEFMTRHVMLTSGRTRNTVNKLHGIIHVLHMISVSYLNLLNRSSDIILYDIEAKLRHTFVHTE